MVKKVTVKDIEYKVRVVQIDDLDGVREGTILGWRWKRRKHEGKTPSSTVVRKSVTFDGGNSMSNGIELIGAFCVVAGTGEPAKKKEMSLVLERRGMKKGGRGAEQLLEDVAKLKIIVSNYLNKEEVLKGLPYVTALKFTSGRVSFTAVIEFKFKIPQAAMRYFPKMELPQEVPNLLRKLTSANGGEAMDFQVRRETIPTSPQRTPYGDVKHLEPLEISETAEKKQSMRPYGAVVPASDLQVQQATRTYGRIPDKQVKDNPDSMRKITTSLVPPEATSRYGRVPEYEGEMKHASEDEEEMNEDMDWHAVDIRASIEVLGPKKKESPYGTPCEVRRADMELPATNGPPSHVMKTKKESPYGTPTEVRMVDAKNPAQSNDSKEERLSAYGTTQYLKR